MSLGETVCGGREALEASDGRAGRLSADRAGQRGADRWIAVVALIGVCGLTCLGWVLSYTALRGLAMVGGFSGWAANLWPLCLDLFVFVATLAALANGWRSRPTTYAWSLAVLYSAATVAGNVAAAGPDRLAEAVHATPAVTMVLAWHLLSRLLLPAWRPGQRAMAGASSRRELAAKDTPRRVRTRSGSGGRPARRLAAVVGELERAGQPVTGTGLATVLGVSDRSGRRLLAEFRASDGGSPDGQ
jgi:Protein of unknown function (DUF2637)